jgi:hypothetical protein
MKIAECIKFLIHSARKSGNKNLHCNFFFAPCPLASRKMKKRFSSVAASQAFSNINAFSMKNHKIKSIKL